MATPECVGSPTRARTWDLRINSRNLASYPASPSATTPLRVTLHEVNQVVDKNINVPPSFTTPLTASLAIGSWCFVS
jgi:hypothetical protein